MNVVFYTEDDGTITMNCAVIDTCEHKHAFKAGDEYNFRMIVHGFSQHLFDAHNIDSVVNFVERKS